MLVIESVSVNIMIPFAIFLCLLSFTAFSAEQKPASQSSSTVADAKEITDDIKANNRNKLIQFGVNFGKDRYTGSFVGLDWGLDPVWQLRVSLGREKNDRITSATQFSLGANARFNEFLYSFVEFNRSREPDSVVSHSVELGTDVTLQKTVLGLALRFARYNQDGLRTRIRDGGIPENSITLKALQNLGESSYVRMAYTKYAFSGATPAELSRAISNRPNFSSDLQSVVDGFPKQSTSLGAGTNISQSTAIDLTVGRVNYANGLSQHSLSLSPEIELSESTAFALLLSTTRTSDDVKNGLIGFTISIALE